MVITDSDVQPHLVGYLCDICHTGTLWVETLRAIREESESMTTTYPVKPPAEVPAGLRTIWRCGFCETGYHGSCPGAVRSGVDEYGKPRVLLCYCCKRPARCLNCGNESEQDVHPELWECIDLGACHARIDQRKQSNPLWRQLQECKVHAVATRRRQRELADRLKAEIGPEPDSFDLITEETIDERVRRGWRPKKTSGTCVCCGAVTKGGEFAPGHDAKFKSRLLKEAKAGDADSLALLEDRGWLTQSARKELTRLGLLGS